MQRNASELLLPLGAVALFCALAWSQGICTQDDAFISFRYAQNLVDGHGLVFNPGERVEGYTNFLWTLLLAGAMSLGFDPVPASRVLGIAAGAGLVFVTWHMARRVVGASPVLRLVPAVGVAALPPVFIEAAMGLETVPFALLVLLGCERLLAERERPGARPWHAVVFGAAALTRPEGALCYALALCAWALADRRALRSVILRAAPAVAIFASIVGAHVAWRLAYYGEPFPNTFYAKTGGGLEAARAGAGYVRDFFASLGWFPVPALVLVAWARAGRPAVLLLQVLATTYLAYVALVGGDFKPTHRFLVPVAAPLALLCAAGLAVLRDALPQRVVTDRRAAVAGAVAALLLAAAPVTSFDDTRRMAALRRAAVADPIRREIADWLRANTPPDELFVHASAGLIPYYSGVRAIDLWGLTDPVIARGPRRGDPWPGHRRSHPRYVLSREPLFILLTPGHGPVRRAVDEIRGSYVVERQLLAQRDFHERYELRNEPLARGYLQIFRRRDPR